VVEPLAARVEMVARSDGPVLGRVESVVRAYFAYLAENPDMPQLMLQELVKFTEPAAALLRPLRRVHAALTALVEEGQALGEVRAGPARVMAIHIVSVPVHLAVVQRALQAHVQELGGVVARPEVMESAVAFVRDGLRAPVEAQEGR
jgi:hypothetical protein